MKKAERKKVDIADIVVKVIIWLLGILLALYALSIIVMLLWGLLTSLKSHTDFGVPGNNVIGFPNLDPNDPSNSRQQFFFWENYTKIFGQFNIVDSITFFSGDRLVEHRVDANFWLMTLYSFIYAGGNGIIQALVPAVMGYMCAKYKYKFSTVIYITVIVVMSLPIVGAYPSEITLLRNLGLYDTFLGNFIQRFSFTGMYFLVFYEFYDAMSDTYREAASIDGASQWTVMVRIYLPLSFTMVGSVLLIRFIFFWNDYTAVNMYMPTHPTLSYAVYWMVYRVSNFEFNRVPIKVAACMILALPTLILFVVLRGKLLGNMTLGGIKE